MHRRLCAIVGGASFNPDAAKSVEALGADEKYASQPMRGMQGAPVGVVSKYTYLGTSPTHPLDNFRARVGMAWAAAKQYEKLWKHSGVGVDTKEMLFSALIETSLTYGLECVTLSVENMQEIDTAHSRLLRYCTRRDRDAYHAYSNGAIPHMSTCCVQSGHAGGARPQT